MLQFSPILLCRRISRLRLVGEKIRLASILGCVRLGVFLCVLVLAEYVCAGCVRLVFLCVLELAKYFWSIFCRVHAQHVWTSFGCVGDLEAGARESMLNTPGVLLVDLGARDIYIWLIVSWCLTFLWFSRMSFDEKRYV